MQQIRVSDKALTLWKWPFLLCMVGTFLYLSLFLLPHTPILMSGDQTFFWMDAQRMLAGEHIYRDFFQFTPPGADLFFYAAFKTFGPRLWVTSGVVFLLGVGLCAACFFVSKAVMDSTASAIATLLFLALVYGRTLNATHHWFSVLAIMIAAGIAMRGKILIRIVAAGSCLGVASFFTQTHGLTAAAAFVIWLVWSDFPQKKSWLGLLARPAILLMAFGVVLLALSSYYLITIGPKALWYYQVSYVREYMVQGLSRFPGLPESVTWKRLPIVGQYLFVCTVLPIVYPLTLIRCFRNGEQVAAREQVALLAFVGLALFLEVAISANWLRLYAVAMPEIVLLVWWGATASKMRRASLTLAAIVALVLALQIMWAHQHQKYVVVMMPGGKVAVTENAYKKLGPLMERTHPGDLLFQTIAPSVYIPLQIRNPVYVDTIWPSEESRPEFVERAIRELESKRVPFILWSPVLNHADPQWPQADHLEPFRTYLHQHYRCVQSFPDHDELWERQ